MDTGICTKAIATKKSKDEVLFIIPLVKVSDKPTATAVNNGINTAMFFIFLSLKSELIDVKIVPTKVLFLSLT